MPADANSRIVLASRSAGLITALRVGLVSRAQLDIASSTREVLDALQDPADPCLVLVDADLPGMIIGQLIAAARSGKDAFRFPIVLISEGVATEWLASVVRAIGDVQEREQVCEASTPGVPIDSATGLYTRAGLLPLLFCETDRVQRMKTSLTVMLFGLDGLGEWKGRLGRATSDELLRQVVERVRRLLRSYDLFGRMGPCEFLLGLPGCTAENAVMLAERILVEVFSEPFSVRRDSVRLTAAFGIASSEGRSPVVVLREAEQELEHARPAGPGSIRVSHQRHCPKAWKMQQCP